MWSPNHFPKTWGCSSNLKRSCCSSYKSSIWLTKSFLCLFNMNIWITETFEGIHWRISAPCQNTFLLWRTLDKLLTSYLFKLIFFFSIRILDFEVKPKTSLAGSFPSPSFPNLLHLLRAIFNNWLPVCSASLIWTAYRN